MPNLMVGCCCGAPIGDDCTICVELTCGLASSIRLLVGSTEVLNESSETGLFGTFCVTFEGSGGTGTIIVEGADGWSSVNKNVEWVCGATETVGLGPTSVSFTLACTFADISSACAGPRDKPTSVNYSILDEEDVVVAGGSLTPDADPIEVTFSTPTLELPATYRVVFTQEDRCWVEEIVWPIEVTCGNIALMPFDVYAYFQDSGCCIPVCCWPYNPPATVHYSDGQLDLDLDLLTAGGYGQWSGYQDVYCEEAVILQDVGDPPYCSTYVPAGATVRIWVTVFCYCYEVIGMDDSVEYWSQFTVRKTAGGYGPYGVYEAWTPERARLKEAVASPVSHTACWFSASPNRAPLRYGATESYKCNTVTGALSKSGDLHYVFEEPGAAPPDTATDFPVCLEGGTFTVEVTWDDVIHCPGDELLAMMTGPELMAGLIGVTTLPEGPEPPLPSVPTMALNYARSTARHLLAGSPEASPELQAARLAICEACPHLRPSDKRCGLVNGKGCGCPTVHKAERLLDECPVGKWPSIDP